MSHVCILGNPPTYTREQVDAMIPHLPLREMKRRGWIRVGHEGAPAIRDELYRFFGICR